MKSRELIDWRYRYVLTQKQAAELLGVSLRSIVTYEGNPQRELPPAIANNAFALSGAFERKPQLSWRIEEGKVKKRAISEFGEVSFYITKSGMISPPVFKPRLSEVNLSREAIIWDAVGAILQWWLGGQRIRIKKLYSK